MKQGSYEEGKNSINFTNSIDTLTKSIISELYTLYVLQDQNISHNWLNLLNVDSEVVPNRIYQDFRHQWEYNHLQPQKTD